jgi:hypothetical protein
LLLKILKAVFFGIFAFFQKYNKEIVHKLSCSFLSVALKPLNFKKALVGFCFNNEQPPVPVFLIVATEHPLFSQQ